MPKIPRLRALSLLRKQPSQLMYRSIPYGPDRDTCLTVKSRLGLLPLCWLAATDMKAIPIAANLLAAFILGI